MFNPDDYRHLKDSLISHFERNKIEASKISEYASSCGIPLVVVYTFIKEDNPELSDWCDSRIKELKEFYGY